MTDNLHPYWTLKAPQGELLLTPCPGSLETPLADALAQLKSTGTQLLISLTSEHELAELGLSDFAAQVAQAGMDWLQLPVADFAAPDAAFEQAWQGGAAAQVQAVLAAGGKVAIHCKGGSGRTGLVAARILLAQSVALDEAISQIQALRPKAFTLPVQLDYIRPFAQA